jgi:hypothetical protein
MKEIVVKPRQMGVAEAWILEEHGLVTFVRHPDGALRAGLKADYHKGDNFPATTHGFHSVTITYTDIFLASHPEGQDEIVFLWDAEKNAKPLYFIFALLKRQQYLEKLLAGKLTTDDYLALRPPMNDPLWSSFAVLHGTVHCECTDGWSRGTLAPSFFVLEPLALDVRRTDESAHGVRLVLGRG